jgi:hypothetical protein
MRGINEMNKRVVASIAVILLTSGIFATANSALSEDQDVTVVPGTHWILSTTYKEGKPLTCQIERNFEDGIILTYMMSIGGNSYAFSVTDKYLDNQISEVFGEWKVGRSFRATIFIDDRSFPVQAICLPEGMLTVFLETIDPRMVFWAKKVSLSVAAIAMRGYDVSDLEPAGKELAKCALQHKRSK